MPRAGRRPGDGGRWGRRQSRVVTRRAVLREQSRDGPAAGARAADGLRRVAPARRAGQVAVPLGILKKGERLSPHELQQFRLHPYHTESILERVPALRHLAESAGAHHERVDGQGYHRRLRGEQIPLHGRILAVADACADILRRQERRINPDAILAELRRRVGTQFDGGCYAALSAGRAEIGRASKAAPKDGVDLTGREREVLGLLTRGLSNPEIAKALVVSRKTVEHHLESIYGKIGVTCRTSAVVYAVQQGIG